MQANEFLDVTCGHGSSGNDKMKIDGDVIKKSFIDVITCGCTNQHTLNTDNDVELKRF